MSSILVPAALLVGLLVLSPIIRILIAALAGPAVGRAALAKLPETIHLTQASSGAFRNAATVDALSTSLSAVGFTEVGSFQVPELPRLALRLLVNPGASCYGIAYDHPHAGIWCELVTRYADGTSASFSTSRPTGMKPRPGHLSVHLAGRDPAAVFYQLQKDRPQSVFAPHSAERAVRDFEQGYADGMAWRKSQGISTQEVVSVAIEKAA